uniref:DUF6598 domain-containing protein n=1 Tax=Aegilops tauschii TaxID=37682 RepID=M8B0M8_AEGTA
MASTEEQVFLGSRNLSYHSAHYPDASADWDYPEDPGDRREGVEVAELHDQPARMSTSDSDPCEVARRALDLMFPREEDSDDVWSTWSAREEGTDDDDEQGKLYPKSEADEIDDKWVHRYSQQLSEHVKLCREIMALRGACVLGLNCHHRIYKTHDTSTTPSTLGERTPSYMLQLFSMRLSSFEPSYPISVYGICAIRDYLDPRRNYVFNRPRDDAVTIEKKALVEVDLWVKKEGDESDDKQLLSAYAEIDVRTEADLMLYERISGDNCNLDSLVEKGAFVPVGKGF